MYLLARLSFLSACLFLVVGTAAAQNPSFMQPGYSFAPKQVSYITMKNGETHEVYIRSYRYKRGVIEEIKVKPAGAKKKVKIQPDDIDYMYIKPNKMAQAMKSMAVLNDATMWADNKGTEYINRGYNYYEQSEAQVKKKKTTSAMMQLLNPSFGSKIKVYHDPYAKETASLGVGGIKVAGGNDKSYYVLPKGAKVAMKLERKNYDENFKKLFGDCPAVMTKYGATIKWNEFVDAVYMYTAECK